MGRAIVPVGGPTPPNGDVLSSHGQPGPLADDPDGKAKARRKRRRRINIVMAAIAVFGMIAGVGLVSGTYYFDNVKLPEELFNADQSTRIYYNDGVTEMARIGDQNRTNIKIKDLKKYVSDAIVATEDNSFYTNDGVDYKGILRAAWNNVTGGERQGASTITQQYARKIADLTDMSYGRKIREAVLAVKLKREYSNEEIMEMYLNTVYFGRQAYGIESASKAFYNKSAKDLSMAEAMGLAAMIKQPAMPDGSPGPYDFATHPDSAKPRFDWIKGQMLKLKFMTDAEAAALQYPQMVPFDPNNLAITAAEWGKTSPTWLVVHHAMDELASAKKADGTPMFGSTVEEQRANIRNGGLKIVTTIDPTTQKHAQEVASPKGQFFKSLKLKDEAKLQDALVAVEPGTGRVKAYYGGDDGSGTDYAGFYRDPVHTDGSLKIAARPPGSTMKIYTVMAGLMAGYSIDSTWDTTEKEIKGSAIPITNAAKAQCEGGEKACKLWEAVRDSTNVPFASLTARDDVGVAKVREAATAAGVRIMEASVNGEAINVDLNNPEKVKEYGGYFGVQIGFGQYGITVLDHANGTATIAARGMAAEAHFVQEVISDGQRIYAEKIAPKQVKGFTQQMADDLCWSMQQVVPFSKLQLAEGRLSAGKSGTWQHPTKSNLNGDAWFVGFTGADTAKKAPGLATAVWLGTAGTETLPLQFARGGEVYGAGGAGPIWREFMNRALKGTPKVQFRPKTGTGHKDVGTGKSPVPSNHPTPTPNRGGLPPDGNNGNNPPGGNGNSPTPTGNPGGIGGGRND